MLVRNGSLLVDFFKGLRFNVSSLICNVAKSLNLRVVYVCSVPLFLRKESEVLKEQLGKDDD